MKGALGAMAVTLAAALHAAASPPPLPAAVTADVGVLRPQGETRLRVLAWRVYDASLWSEGQRWSADAAFALDIRYAVELRGAELAGKSVELMRRLGYDESRLVPWEREMRRVFPDIKPGDRLVGVSVPGREARFYDGQRLLGTVADPEFARAFFAIWLDERTSEPAMRRELLKAP